MSPAKPENLGLLRKPIDGLKGFFAERLGLESVWALAAKKTVPIHRSTPFYFLGGMALFLFGVQIVTGILLSLYYKPSPDQAFESVRAIMTEVEFGWLMRSVHSWSANLLVGVLFLHVLTTFMMRAYRRPREITWITGILLLGVFMAFGFSGYLLPWNELAFFATRVGTSITGKVPVVGHQLLLLARGGEDVTGDTLARFYSLHVVVFPLVAFALLGVHLFLVQKHGMSIPDGEAAAQGGGDKVPEMPFLPHFLLRDMVGWYLAVGILAALAALFPWELGKKADPFGTAPAGIQPEWYFLFMFQALKQLPAYLCGGQTSAAAFDVEGDVLGVLFFGFCGLVVLLVPLLDRGDGTRRILNNLAALAVVFFIVMTARGWFSEEMGLRIALATSLFLGMLVLTIPFLGRASPAPSVSTLEGIGLKPHFLIGLKLRFLSMLEPLTQWSAHVLRILTPEGIRPEWYFLIMLQPLHQLARHVLEIEPVKQWIARVLKMEAFPLDVLFFGLCGLMVVVVPVFDRGERSRRVLECVAASAMVLFVVVIGSLSYPEEACLRTILGSTILLGMVVLVAPYLERGSFARRVLNTLFAVDVLILMAATAWDLLA